MIRLVLLAAGASRRFGSNKLLYEVDGKALIMHALEKLIALGMPRGWEVTLVTREGPISALAEGLPVKTLINPDADNGISTSVRCAVDDMISDADAAVFFVADQPYISEETLAAFIDGFAASGKKCGCVTWDGETGNPCAFTKELFPELSALTGDRGGKKVLMQHLDSCYFHEAGAEKELTDIDTPE